MNLDENTKKQPPILYRIVRSFVFNNLNITSIPYDLTYISCWIIAIILFIVISIFRILFSQSSVAVVVLPIFIMACLSVWGLLKGKNSFTGYKIALYFHIDCELATKLGFKEGSFDSSDNIFSIVEQLHKQGVEFRLQVLPEEKDNG